MIWRLVLLLAFLACVWVFHPAILRAVARGLIVDRRADSPDCLWIRSDAGPSPEGDRCYDRAAELYHADTSRRILLIEPKPKRVVRIGVLPRFAPVARRQLAERGVPEDAVTLLDGEPVSDWDEARILASWLHEHPGSHVLLLCDRFRSRRWRHILDGVLEPDAAARTGILALRHRRYDETNWWKSRAGAKTLFYAYVGLAYARRPGEPVPPPDPWDPDAYERMLQAAGGDR